VASEVTKLALDYPTNHSLATPALTPTGVLWRDTVEQRSGGTRPGFAGSFAFWGSFGFAPLASEPFLFGVYPGLSGGTIGVAAGNVAGNKHTVYRFDQGEKLSPAEKQLNREVLRVRPTEETSYAIHNWTKGPLKGTPEGIPDVQGTPGIPVLSIHGIGDLFVPFAMEQVYAQRVARHDQSDLFVSRAIREVNHCSYTDKELSTGFADLITWAHSDWAEGEGRPAGDEVLDPQDVASPSFGCTFTDQTSGAHPIWTAVGNPPCPKPSRDRDGRD
ncbi:MAG TPA: hypothetical protein VGN54_01305, partial [Mycobacteriales bacterium]|nr:hypothetical protein [Mycobacteriales bacterium]